jgi:hypothetical protein
MHTSLLDLHISYNMTLFRFIIGTPTSDYMSFKVRQQDITLQRNQERARNGQNGQSMYITEIYDWIITVGIMICIITYV